jgi:glycosyltransferase involved in cell wall biosynthesis
MPRITVIIPTRGLPERMPLLQRAVTSALDQCDVAVSALVIVNGACDDAAVRQALGTDRRIRMVVRAQADLPAALRDGAHAMTTDWFTTLDDDDLLLPGALKLRHSALERHPDRVVVVTNGIRRTRDANAIHVTDGSGISADPLAAMMRRNWLLPGSWLARVTPETRALFDRMPRHLECTYLGIRFATLGMVWLDTPTVVYHVGSPHSLSESREFVDGQAPALRTILTLELPVYVRRELTRRVAAAYHRAANVALRCDALRDAWRFHLATLREPTGWRYLPFMRHLIAASLRRNS